MKNNVNTIKRLCLVALLVSGALCSTAQDTMLGPKENYYYTFWLGDNYLPHDTASYIVALYPFMHGRRDLLKYFHTDTVLEIHGIAAAITSWYSIFDSTLDRIPCYGYDTSLIADKGTTNLFEYLRLYTPSKDGDSMILRNQARVHYTEDTFDHYLYAGQGLGSICHSLYQKVFEVYFDTVSYVSGDFFVGISQTNSNFQVEHYFRTWPLGIVQMGYSTRYLSATSYEEERTRGFDTLAAEGQFGIPGWKQYTIDSKVYIFPILDHNCHVRPPEDTMRTDGPVGVKITVSPNPTGTMAVVASEAELTGIEAYTAAGMLHARVAASGRETRLEVSAWPAGEYVLRIATRQGTVTRRLTVAR